jgi:hypothetical protein
MTDSSSDRWPSRWATRVGLLTGIPIAVLLGAHAISWAAAALKTWNDGDTLTAADLNANFAALNAAIGDGGALSSVAVTPPLSGNGSTQSPLKVKSVYQVWGRTACGAGDSVIHTGYFGAFGASTGAMGGEPMCIDDQLAMASWTGWAAALVSRANSDGVAGNRAEYLSQGDVHCAVCKGFSYVLWGRTACDTGDTALYTGHVAHLNYNALYGGYANAGPVCLDDAIAGAKWINAGGNSIVARAAGANAANYSQYLEAHDAPCVVCQ